MKKFTETKYYEQWYAQIEENEIKKMNIARIMREYNELLNSLEKDHATFEEKAILFAQCIHRPQLKSPSQAVYPDISKFDVTQVGADLWEVSGYCDAPNSYGALTRDNFTIRMRYHGDNFEYIISKDKIHNQMIGVAAVLGFILIAACGILAPILLL